MKKIAVIFKSTPHGSSAGREGLDAVLAISALTENISLFFISDGVFHLLPDQQPEEILARNYISTFGVLSLYEIDDIYVCSESIESKGIAPLSSRFIIAAKRMTASEISQKLATYHTVLTF